MVHDNSKSQTMEREDEMKEEQDELIERVMEMASLTRMLFNSRRDRDQWKYATRTETTIRLAAEKERDGAITERDLARQERDLARQERDLAMVEAKEERSIARQERTESEKKKDAAMAREASAIKERDAAMAREASAIKERDAAMAREASAIKERDAAMAREASAIKERDAAMAREASAIENALVERRGLLHSALAERRGWSQERQRLLESALTERQGWSTERHRLLDIISIGSAGFANLNDFSRPKIESAARKLKALTNGDTVKIESRGYFGSTILDKEDFVELKVFTGSQSNVADSIASDTEERSSKIFTVLSPTVNPTTINDDLCQDWEAVLTKRGISEEVGISEILR
jgi:hypothetical protein